MASTSSSDTSARSNEHTAARLIGFSQ
jgi:hypothetical protein